MECSKYLELMSAALDGELTAEERRALDNHMANCPDCAQLFSILSENAKAMRDMDCEMPADLKQRIMSNLPQQEQPAKQGKVIHWKRWAPIAAAACLALVVVAIPKSGSHKSFDLASAPAEVAPAAPAPSAAMDNASSYKSNSESYTGNLEMGGLTDPAEAPMEPGAAPISPSSGEIAEPGHYMMENQRAISVDYGATPAPGAVIVGSVESLEQYLAQFGSNSFDSEDNPLRNKELDALAETYTEDYFRSRRLLCVVVESGSGSNRFEIDSQGLSQHFVTVKQETPEVGTCDMAAWLLVAEVDSMFSDGDTLDVIINIVYK